MMRLVDPYAVALSMLIGSVGFGMTYFFNTNFSTWGMQEIAYPALAMVYVYVRNGRFFVKADDQTACSESDNCASVNGVRINTSLAAPANNTAVEESLASGGNKVQVPLPAEGVSGARVVSGSPLLGSEEGALVVVFFWATWCGKCQKCLPALVSTAGRYSEEGVRFAGVSQESEDDLRYFMEIYQRPLQSVAFIVDEEGTFTDRYQGAHGLNTIPHCYIVRIAGSDSSSVVGVVEWHGHPTRLETALSYLLEGEDEGEDEKEEVR